MCDLAPYAPSLLMGGSSRTFPLGATAVRVDVRLDEADVALDDGADVLHPVLGALLVRVDGARLEATVRRQTRQ